MVGKGRKARRLDFIGSIKSSNQNPTDVAIIYFIFPFTSKR